MPWHNNPGGIYFSQFDTKAKIKARPGFNANKFLRRTEFFTCIYFLYVIYVNKNYGFAKLILQRCFMDYQSPENCPYHLISRAALAATAMLKKELDSRGITEVKPAYLGVLMCLWQGAGMDEVLGKLGAEDGMKITDLGRCAGLEPSTMTGLLDRMERDGLAYRANDPHDRRALKIHLTERGAEIRNQIFETVDALDGDIFAGITPGQMETTRWVLQKILSNAGKVKP